MGSIFSARPQSPSFVVQMTPTAPRTTPLTHEEREHLITLGTISGGPDIVLEAINSRNIFDPAHMDKAFQSNAKWEEGVRLINEAAAKQQNTPDSPPF